MSWTLQIPSTSSPASSFEIAPVSSISESHWCLLAVQPFLAASISNPHIVGTACDGQCRTRSFFFQLPTSRSNPAALLVPVMPCPKSSDPGMAWEARDCSNRRFRELEHYSRVLISILEKLLVVHAIRLSVRYSDGIIDIVLLLSVLVHDLRSLKMLE